MIPYSLVDKAILDDPCCNLFMAVEWTERGKSHVIDLIGNDGRETGTVKCFKLHGVTSHKTVAHRTSLLSWYWTSLEILLFWRNERLVTSFSGDEHWIVSWSSWIQTHILHSVFLRFILILFSHIRVVVTLHGLCAQSFPDKRVYKFLVFRVTRRQRIVLHFIFP